MTATLSLAQTRGLVEAGAYAEQIGLRMNRMVTVHWGAMGLSDAEALAATGRLLKHIRDTLAEMGLPFACAWTRENDDGDASKGAHTHILVHVPTAAGQGFMRRVRGWVRLAAGARYNRRSRRIEGRAYATGAINTRAIGGRLRIGDAEHARNLAKTMTYMMKGGALETVKATLAHPMLSSVPVDCLYRGGRIRHSEGGRVTGKRCGWSANLGAGARRNVDVAVCDQFIKLTLNGKARM